MGWEFFDVVRFDLGPLLQGQMRTAKLSAYDLPIIDPKHFQCETYLQNIMGWESSVVVRFDLWSNLILIFFLQGQTMVH